MVAEPFVLAAGEGAAVFRAAVGATILERAADVGAARLKMNA